MKAFLKSVKFVGASLVFLALAACGKSDSGNNVAAIQYGYVNNQCYDVTHNTPASYNLCTGVGTQGQFQYINNQCVSTANNQVVDPTYCQQSQYGQYGGQYGNQYGGQYGYGAGPVAYPYGQLYAQYSGSAYYGSSYGGGAYSGTVPCNGMFYQMTGGYAQLIQCTQISCHGMFLYTTSTKVPVLCN